MSSCLEARLPDWARAQLPEPSVPCTPPPIPKDLGAAHFPSFPNGGPASRLGTVRQTASPLCLTSCMGVFREGRGKEPLLLQTLDLGCGFLVEPQNQVVAPWGGGGGGSSALFDGSIQAWFPEERPQADFGCAVPRMPLSTPQAGSRPTAAKPQGSYSCGRSLAPPLEEQD